MYIKLLVIGFLTIGLISCNSTPNAKKTNKTDTYPDIKIVGAMKNVMWKGQLDGTIYLDSIKNKNGLYGLGPVSHLTGELLVSNGKSYVSKVTSDSTMTVEKTFKTSAPFFVYANVSDWNKVELPSDIKNIKDLEQFINGKTKDSKRPFAFKLVGSVKSAIIHIQNLPQGTKVSSPQEAHQGQTNYKLANENAEIVGFFSTAHKGVFTHHDSFLHMHLITEDHSKMGHLDSLKMREMTLYLPEK